MSKDLDQLTEVISKIINIRRTQVAINPTWIATEALRELDPENVAPELVRMGCHLHLRQIARSLCRKQFEPSEEDDPEEPIFVPFRELQWRYPTVHSRDESEHVYILRDQMTRDDVRYNVARLRREAHAKLDHAQALEEWDLTRVDAA